MDSILTSIKKLLGIDPDYTHFDADLILHINSVFSILNQLGVGPSTGFAIADSYAVWTDFLGESLKLELVKTYVSLKVKLIFDPPLSSAAMEAVKEQIKELEWRIAVTVNPGEEVIDNADE